MKPWEETWRRGEQKSSSWLLQEVVTPTGSLTISGRNSGDHAGDESRANLMIAAPELVRALLAVEWQEVEYLPTHACVNCHALDSVGHAPDCALDAALKKASVR